MPPFNDPGENWHDYEIDSPREIIALLRGIAKSKQLIRMLIRGEADVCVTSILDIDADNNVVILDRSVDRQQNTRAVAARSIGFETTLDKIRILFDTDQLSEVMFEDQGAFAMPVPATMIRLQRREFYRMPTPLSNPVRVSIPLPPEMGGGTSIFPLADISCGGIAILDNKLLLGNTIGKDYLNCKLDLPEIGQVPATLQIRNSLDMTLLNNKPNRRLGCAFVNLSRGALAQIQRYITRLERDRNARSAGLA